MLRVVEAFSGIGSQAKALKKLGIEFKVVNTVEWDIAACYAYDLIHNGEQDLTEYLNIPKDELLRILTKYSLSTDGKTPVNMRFLKTWPEDSLRKVLCAINRTRNLGSITDVTCDMLPKKIDLLTYSFPCQDLSICGSWHGNMSGIDRTANNRSGMLWEVERILKEMHEAKRKLPKFLLMENVSNILSKTHFGNFKEWQDFLEELGYVNKVYMLNAANFGSPQKRVRTYMLSVFCPDERRKKVVQSYFEKNDLEKQEPMKRRDIKTCFRTDYSIKQYKIEADISNMNDTPSRRKIFEDNEIVFDGIRFVTDSVNTLTTKQDRNPTSGLIVYPEHAPGKSIYRNFTPRECFLLMGFDEQDYESVAANNIFIRKDKLLYSRERFEKLAGNSIVVDVLVAIFAQVDQLNTMLWNGAYIPRNGEKRKYKKHKQSLYKTVPEIIFTDTEKGMNKGSDNFAKQVK
ncbi:DNA (cytosine-5-)-methyltransferase [Enterocloster clostridioformis]|uniref:Cytosine-specific methyltransferase n=1 Tax=Enterocloster clostridioformis TaxID=1531 RepID=A0A1I0IV14_9FIRM|nr:DNA (cytosine-5-)-methyltransferase [Enterocloster clostridioformis]SEU01138.1 DNA (cytosine-5)-methyltransferase 1 [Enterocloster clostridioformis]SEW41606.1 DNA (cytosine-5)-methyltransferase 1 [Enterocloster clostridioformis]